MTMTIEVINNGALNLLTGMERLNLIRVNTPIKNTVESGKNISKHFAGAMKLSDTDYETYQNAVQKSRDEWNRDIY